ncbi:tripartite tricarboxylate transporter TctB family protein [Azospirillum sp. ST 5-10]|uniref:tripartite tricarboxylate transporter TctB family protein n=1 Tax=unclassified Azospirillum TaxID=2630922 RepID=UPI003F49CB1F
MDTSVLRRVAAPVGLIAAMLVLPRYIFTDPAMADGLPAAVGPDGWPRALIIGVLLCSAAWILRELWMAARVRPAAAAPEEAAEPYDHVMAWTGMGIVVVYTAAIPALGFPVATLLFLGAWCVLGGVRRPLTVGLVGVLGTVVLLYVFVRLAHMPLDRGAGVFDGVTIALYRAIGIY